MLLSLILATVPIIPNGAAFTCTPEAAWDGDGPIWCKEGPRIRLGGIAAREIDESCATRHPCPSASGVAARDHLAGLLGTVQGIAATGHVRISGAPLQCVSQGSAGDNRTAAFCRSPESGDISCAMVHDGYAVRWDGYWGAQRCD